MRRYPGITPFKQEDAPVFKGRKRASEEVKNLILTQKMLVLFAKSGMGKTSLLNAGVVPGLKQYGLYPIYIRFNLKGASDDQKPIPRFLEQYQQVVDDFNLGRLGAKSFQSGVSLWQTLCQNQLVSRQGIQIPVLIFDQFEEFFNTYPRKEDRAIFLQQLAELLSDTIPHGNPLASQQDSLNGEIQPLNLRAVFSIRSDRLNEMQEVSEFIPFVMRTRYQLDPLTEKQATDAIREPGLVADGPYESGLITFPDSVITDILNGLKDPHSGEIESFQLQLVCSTLEDKYIRADNKGSETTTEHTVSTADYGGSDGIQKINQVYFTDTINGITTQPIPRRKIIIGLSTLLTDTGNRVLNADSQLRLDSDEVFGVKEKLVDRRILKREIIQANTYFEISHDKIALALRTEKNQLEKEIQEEQERARQEQEQLEAEKAEKERLQKRNTKIGIGIAAIIGLLGILSIILYFQAEEARKQAEDDRNSAKASAEQARDSSEVAKAQRLLAVTEKQRADSNAVVAKIAAQYALRAVENLNDTRLRNAWSDFELTKKLMTGRLFREASINLKSLQSRIPTRLAQIDEQSGKRKALILRSYNRLRKFVHNARTICNDLIPIQNLVEDAQCLEQNYYLACANKKYLEAQKNQLKFQNIYKPYPFPKEVLATHVDLTNADIRTNISLGINGSYRLNKDKISKHIDTLTTTCSCTSFLAKKE